MSYFYRQAPAAARLERRIAELERELARLRASRRVLLNLVALQDRQQQLRIGALERENRRLRLKHHRRPGADA
jgi:hypothetical protein